jgi:hypothetical protein
MRFTQAKKKLRVCFPSQIQSGIESLIYLNMVILCHEFNGKRHYETAAEKI